MDLQQPAQLCQSHPSSFLSLQLFCHYFSWMYSIYVQPKALFARLFQWKQPLVGTIPDLSASLNILEMYTVIHPTLTLKHLKINTLMSTNKSPFNYDEKDYLNNLFSKAAPSHM